MGRAACANSHLPRGAAVFGKPGLLQLYPGWWHLCLPHSEPDWVSAFELLCSYPISDLMTPTVLHGSPLAGVLTTTRCQNTVLCGTLSQARDLSPAATWHLDRVPVGL